VWTGSLTPQDSVYRLGANFDCYGTTLTLGAGNVLSGAGRSLMVGSPIMNAQTVVTGAGKVSVWAGQGYDGPTNVNRGSVLSLGRNTAGLSAFTDPFGSGDTLTAIAGTVNLTGDVTALPSQSTWNLFNTYQTPGAAGGTGIVSTPAAARSGRAAPTLAGAACLSEPASRLSLPRL
jgi:hypothetical protein